MQEIVQILVLSILAIPNNEFLMATSFNVTFFFTHKIFFHWKILRLHMATNRVAIGFTALFVLFLIVASVVSIYREGALFIPGLSPTAFKKDDRVMLSVNKITSIHEPIPYRYNDLPVCTPPPEDIKSTSRDNIGAIVTGDRIESSSYKVWEVSPRSPF